MKKAPILGWGLTANQLSADIILTHVTNKRLGVN